ncbi:hypothetical protein KPB2_5365 [Klebsiella pneumoniae Kb677]|nr:hypothetical protein KPB2_5365 [Klebsiella pneumoniae Kb677]
MRLTGAISRNTRIASVARVDETEVGTVLAKPCVVDPAPRTFSVTTFTSVHTPTLAVLFGARARTLTAATSIPARPLTTLSCWIRLRSVVDRPPCSAAMPLRQGASELATTTRPLSGTTQPGTPVGVPSSRPWRSCCTPVCWPSRFVAFVRLSTRLQSTCWIRNRRTRGSSLPLLLPRACANVTSRGTLLALPYLAHKRQEVSTLTRLRRHEVFGARRQVPTTSSFLSDRRQVRPIPDDAASTVTSTL